MGVSIWCKKTHRSIDMGYGGFNRLRNKVADLVGEPWASHYHKLDFAPLFRDARKDFFEYYDAETQRLLDAKKVSVKSWTSAYSLNAKGPFGMELARKS